MADLCQFARNSVAVQREVFRFAEQDHGLTLKVLHLKTNIPLSTLKGWREGAAMPAWGIGALGTAGVPDHLLSLILEPFQRHVGTDEDGEGDLDTAAIDASEFAQAVQRARHPNSPGGVAIVPQEKSMVIPIARRASASARRAVAGGR